MLCTYRYCTVRTGYHNTETHSETDMIDVLYIFTTLDQKITELIYRSMS